MISFTKYEESRHWFYFWHHQNQIILPSFPTFSLIFLWAACCFNIWICPFRLFCLSKKKLGNFQARFRLRWYVDCSHKYKITQGVMVGERQPLVEDNIWMNITYDANLWWQHLAEDVWLKIFRPKFSVINLFKLIFCFTKKFLNHNFFVQYFFVIWGTVGQHIAPISSRGTPLKLH